MPELVDWFTKSNGSIPALVVIEVRKIARNDSLPPGQQLHVTEYPHNRIFLRIVLIELDLKRRCRLEIRTIVV